ncbi:hypothetical protein [Alicyclobacillus sp. ALC3]|uniref:hypothetical protein n=1 Tax=Alicyclobacillus sp. ALC3 TaxID=2796143 RepID=UPI002379B646|nr:hypothetical protein [Alicyclobacillus sp. ALC3]WDL95505.1 hypothetical protein JC200_14010 [Alicyclobacillus sp. ALC3]
MNRKFRLSAFAATAIALGVVVHLESSGHSSVLASTQPVHASNISLSNGQMNAIWQQIQQLLSSQQQNPGSTVTITVPSSSAGTGGVQGYSDGDGDSGSGYGSGYGYGQVPQSPQLPAGVASGSSTVSTSGAQTVPLSANTQASQNWAGYIDTPTGNTPYTSISGSWTVPTISGSANSAAAQWIGLGGVTTRDLLQMGTIEDYQNGQAVAHVFWEKLPNAATNILTVPAGSTVHANISKSTGNTWLLTVTARTPSGSVKTKTVPVSLSSAYAQGIGTSAEWISEDPSGVNNNLYPLANMGTVHYTGATVNGSALGASANQVAPVAMVGGYGNILVAPSNLGSGNRSFSTQTVQTSSGVYQEVAGNSPSYSGSGYGNGESGYASGGSGYASGGSGYASDGSGYASGGSGYASDGSGYASSGSGYGNGESGYTSGGSGYLSGYQGW